MAAEAKSGHSLSNLAKTVARIRRIPSGRLESKPEVSQSVSHMTESLTESSILEVQNRLVAQQAEQSRLADLLEKIQVSLYNNHQESLMVISGMKEDIFMKLDSICPEILEPKFTKLTRDASKASLASTQKSIDVMRQRQERQDQSLRALIQEELHRFSVSATSEAKLDFRSPSIGNRSQSQKDFEDLGALAEHFDAQLGYEDMWDFQNQGLRRSYWTDLGRAWGFEHLLVNQAPKTLAARLAEHHIFVTFQTLLILTNTYMVAYESDLQVKASLAAPNGNMPDWLKVVNTAFNIAFAVEMIFRMFALRLWFWVSPDDCVWNMFDFVLVSSSLALDILGNTGFVFLRTFRILRVLRVARVARVLRFFRQLREMLYAILACLESLGWSLLFMGITIFVFSLMCLQGATEVLIQMDEGSLVENVELRGEVERYFGSMKTATLSLLASVTGGVDWFEVYDPLSYAGLLYPTVFIAYMLFITFGVMNVLTGVFLKNAENFTDVDLIVQKQEARTNEFVRHMISIFSEMDSSDGSGAVTYKEFCETLNNKTTQAFLQHLELDTTHARLIFDLLDKEKTGKVEPAKFVMGMVRLRGNSKAIDTRVILRELSLLPQMLREFRSSQ